VVSEPGGLSLPAFASEDRHTAEVDHINRAVRERFGLSTTVLRSLRHAVALGDVVVRVHELQARGDGTPPPSRLRWCGRDELSARVAGEDAEVIAEWLAADAAPGVTDGREWTRPGWFEEACGWTERALAEAGAHEVREVVQLRAWTSSCVLFVRTGAGDFHFKAVARSIGHEGAVTAYLARHFPAPGRASPAARARPPPAR
jgi:hypothetical protein